MFVGARGLWRRRDRGSVPRARDAELRAVREAARADADPAAPPRAVLLCASQDGRCYVYALDVKSDAGGGGFERSDGSPTNAVSRSVESDGGQEAARPSKTRARGRAARARDDDRAALRVQRCGVLPRRRLRRVRRRLRERRFARAQKVRVRPRGVQNAGTKLGSRYVDVPRAHRRRPSQRGRRARRARGRYVRRLERRLALRRGDDGFHVRVRGVARRRKREGNHTRGVPVQPRTSVPPGDVPAVRPQRGRLGGARRARARLRLAPRRRARARRARARRSRSRRWT